ncbi:MAG: glycosyltransferase family 39 protein [Chloroflexi bacterium]|nr:glycosyltransferase family 39 protein [Chloroflexota bacterium]
MAIGSGGSAASNRLGSRNVRLLFWGILVLATVAMVWAQTLGFPLDVDHYKFWTKLVTEQGVQGAYSGEFPHTYAIYPPVTLYFYWGIGQVYRSAIDPAFDMDRALDNSIFTTMIRLPAMVFHLLTAGLVYGWVSRRMGRGPALLATVGYAWQPGIIFDVAVWGQPDPVHSFFTAATVMLLLSGRVGWAGAAFATAALTKPQAWVLAPLFVFFAWRRFSFKGLGVAGFAGVTAAAGISAPFLLYGTWGQLVRLPISIASVDPTVSANADNLWWLLFGEHAFGLMDSEPFLFGISYGIIGMALVGLSVLFAIVRLEDDSITRSLPAMAAFQSFAFFMLTTKAHENHGFLVLPLLSLVWLRSRALTWLYLAFSLTFLANVGLHDPAVEGAFDANALGALLRPAQRLNALLNTAILFAWGGMVLFFAARRSVDARNAIARGQGPGTG